MKKVALVVVVIVFVQMLVAETEYKNGLGLAGGMTSGMGFSYKRINDNNGFQFTFGFLSNNNRYNSERPEYGADTTAVFTGKQYDSNLLGNFGINYHHYLHKGENSLFYLMAGSAIYFDCEWGQEVEYGYISENSEDDYPVWEETGNTKNFTEVSQTVNIGAGIGIDYKLTKLIHISLELPITLSLEADRLNVYMVPQSGIHYFFK
ncbi:MAG: hypothetical protein U9N34_07640 [Candidatus Cloacimonadota bacterium]|nr:hypothetical protein [Candidatus Cloacimonadota bacterium]